MSLYGFTTQAIFSGVLRANLS